MAAPVQFELEEFEYVPATAGTALVRVAYEEATKTFWGFYRIKQYVCGRYVTASTETRVAIFTTAKRMVVPDKAEGFDELYRVTILPDGEYEIIPV